MYSNCEREQSHTRGELLILMATTAVHPHWRETDVNRAIIAARRPTATRLAAPLGSPGHGGHTLRPLPTCSRSWTWLITALPDALCLRLPPCCRQSSCSCCWPASFGCASAKRRGRCELNLLSHPRQWRRRWRPLRWLWVVFAHNPPAKHCCSRLSTPCANVRPF